jgi:hypothetical protein
MVSFTRSVEVSKSNRYLIDYVARGMPELPLQFYSSPIKTFIGAYPNRMEPNELDCFLWHNTMSNDRRSGCEK